MIRVNWENDTWCEEVIITHKLRGNGRDDPFRSILHVFRKDGTLLATAHDPLLEDHNKENSQ